MYEVCPKSCRNNFIINVSLQKTPMDKSEIIKPTTGKTHEHDDDLQMTRTIFDR